MLGLEGDDVDQDVGSLAECLLECSRLAAVDADVPALQFVRHGPLAPTGDHDLPTALEETPRDRPAGLARAPEQECGLRHPADDINVISRYPMKPERSTSPLFVRIPIAAAEWLDRASFELKRPKQELVAEALRSLDVAKPPVGFARPAPGSRDVLTTAQLAELLQTDEKTVRDLARRRKLPGRKVGRDWRFSRAAVLDWLAGP